MAQGVFICSAQSSNGSASLQEQMHLLADESRSRDTKHRSEIQCEALEFSEEHKSLCDLN